MHTDQKELKIASVWSLFPNSIDSQNSFIILGCPWEDGNLVLMKWYQSLLVPVFDSDLRPDSTWLYVTSEKYCLGDADFGLLFIGAAQPSLQMVGDSNDIVQSNCPNGYQ